jgi:hypothetical protein
MYWHAITVFMITGLDYSDTIQRKNVILVA